MENQLLVYEVKSSASQNSDVLFDQDQEFFYWNQHKFKNLDLEDYVIVVNNYSKFVLFTSLDEKAISADYDITSNETSFTDSNNIFKVSGKWQEFIRLKILQKIDLPENWEWKSLGSSETTYLLGERINLEASKNRLENITQFKKLPLNNEFESLLNEAIKVFDTSIFSNSLERFIRQSQTASLKTSHYPKNYKGLKVKVSFGQGGAAKIPWISFLGEGQTTSDGIYPVYLYYKDISKLILSYGVSETHRPDINWNIKSDKIKDYFKEQHQGNPQRYGASYVFKVYEANNLPDQNELDNELDSIIKEYNEVIMNNSTKVDCKIKKELSDDILLAFKKWYDSSDHKTKEDYYQGEVELNALSNMSDNAIIDFFVQFKKEGGRIQSTDNRGIEDFKRTIDGSIDRFRKYILKPFSQNFDVIKWLSELHSFKNFGIGTATIYLNRVDKYKFPPLNNKVRDAFNLIGSRKLPTNDINAYSVVSELSKQMINSYDCFENFFQTDAFTQFIIGENEGMELINNWAKNGLRENKEFAINDFQLSLEASGLLFSKKLISRFVASLITKPFIILSGLSGSGKTKMAQAFAQWICQDDSQFCIVPVGADWTNREPLLGFPNALDSKEYVKPDNGVLDLIMKASNNQALPFFLILDEMNLSHVERYFADFLSVMESNEVISLHSSQEDSDNGVPNKVSLPLNLFIIGTVNIDETTYMFSPKVLDRANTIEFRVDENDLIEFLNNNKSVDMSTLKGKGANMAVDFLSYSKNKTAKIDKDLNKVLIGFFSELKKAGAEFGYRTANEIQVLIEQLGSIEESLNDQQKLDIAIMQKLLPKLHGSRRKLEPILLTLGKMCLKGDIKEEEFKKLYFSNKVNDYENNPEIIFPISLEKICRMHQSAIDHGFASYAEA